MIILNNFYQDDSLFDLIQNLEFIKFPYGETLTDFQFIPPDTINLINDITHTDSEIIEEECLIFKPNNLPIINQSNSLYIILEDCTFEFDNGCILNLIKNQFIILNYGITHKIKEGIIQLISFKEKGNDILC